jgi:hypothetical protein
VSVTAGPPALLRDRAAAVLRGNDAGRWTKASPHLYPHQWSWDSAFNAIGWAHLDVRRAMAELEGLFAAQWSTGMVPHIVFRAGPDEPYFPGPEWWDCAVAPAAPAPPVQTTGICQPPVHALALQRIWQLTPEPQRPEIRARLQTLFPRLVKWHRYLATQRDPEASGLVTVYHPWEGTDNSPRWDHALARIKVVKPRPFTRLDTQQVSDPSQRPTDWDYDRYLWLVGLLRKYRYDDAEIYRRYPFLIKDVFFSSVLVAANAALLDLAGVAGASDGDRRQLARWLDRGREGLAGCFDPESGLCLDYDVRNEEHIRLRTFAGFAPLFAGTAETAEAGLRAGTAEAGLRAGTAEAGRREAQLRLLDSADFCGDPRLRWRLLPSTSPAEPAFEPRNYWRGPVWPVIDWLLWHSLRLLGCSDRADELRRDSLAQIAAAGDFAEYFEPFTGEPLGSPQQSWTAAVTLDWTASDPGIQAT